MKKSILSFVLVFCGVAMTAAQTTEFDAIKMAQTDITGSARYMGMAGAFGALGGDVSAIKDNPAGLGVYRSWEMTTTFNFFTQKSTSKWEGQNANDDMYKFGFNNVALVMSFPTWASQHGSKGLLQSNWGFSYNRLKNFNRNTTFKNNDMATSITDYLADFTQRNKVTAGDFIYKDDIDAELFFGSDKSYLSWASIVANETGIINDPNGDGNWQPFLAVGDLAASSYNLRERGYIDEYSISWGGNISNIVYLGAALNFTRIDYSKSVEYNELYDYDSPLYTASKLSTIGNGFNFNLGVIVRPFDQLRLGVSYQTPTLYSLRDDIWDAHYDGFYAPDTYYNYETRTPGKLTASVAGIIGKKAIISADIVFTNYKNIKLFDYDGSSNYYEYENNIMKNNFKTGITAKVGAEYRITNHFSLRAGFATETVSMASDASLNPMLNTVRLDTDYYIHKGTSYFTAGLGYRGNSWYIDGAFVNKNLSEDFMPYNSTNFSPAKVTTRNYDVVATIGFKF